MGIGLIPVRLIGDDEAAAAAADLQISWSDFNGNMSGGFPLQVTAMECTTIVGDVDVRGLEMLSSFIASTCGVTSMLCNDALQVLNLLACPLEQIVTLPAPIIDLNLSSCSLSESDVDNYLAQLVANGQENGQVNLSGNTAPSAAGTDDANILVARGWTVTTD